MHLFYFWRFGGVPKRKIQAKVVNVTGTVGVGGAPAHGHAHNAVSILLDKLKLLLVGVDKIESAFHVYQVLKAENRYLSNDK